MEDPKLPNIANEKVPQQDDTQLQILKQLQRQNALLEEQLALQKEQKRKEEEKEKAHKQRLKDEAVRRIIRCYRGINSEKKTAYEIPITISDKSCVFLGIALCGVTYSYNDLKKIIVCYIRDNKLLIDEKNIIIDKKLSEFLGLSCDKQVSYGLILERLEYAI